MRIRALPGILLAAILFAFTANLCLSGVLTAAPSPREPDDKRVAEIARLLSPETRGLGSRIEGRLMWDYYRSLPEYEEIIQEARSAMDAPLPAMTEDIFLDFSRTGNRRRGERVIRERRGRFPLLVLAECVEAEGKFLPAIEQSIRSVCEEATWVLPAHDRGLGNFRGKTVEIDLSSAATSWNLATAMFWLGEKLRPEIRDLVRQELDRRTFRPYEESIRTGTPRLWWVTGSNNWNSVCHAGVVGAALATIESRERRAFFVAAAEKNIEHFLGGFTPDGYCSEGLGYWNYGFGHYLLLAETVFRATEGKLDLLARPEVKRIAFFGPRMEILPGVYPAFADCSLGSRPDRRMMAFLSERLKFGLEPLLAPDLRHRPTTSLFTLGVYGFLHNIKSEPPMDPLVEIKSPKGILRDWFPDAGILIARPARDRRSRALGVALKGGHNAEHHNHNDVGSYVVALAGETPLVDPGAEVYTARTFSGRRYESQVLNSFGHPVPRIAGKLQRTGSRAAGRVIDTEFKSSQDKLVLDIRSAYDVPTLERLVRTFVFSREGTGSLQVQDEVKLSKPATYETALITFLEWRREGEDRLVVGKGPAAVEVRIDSGGAPVKIEAEQIQEDVRTSKKPTRIGIVLAEPVTSARVTLRISPREDDA